MHMRQMCIASGAGVTCSSRGYFLYSKVKVCTPPSSWLGRLSDVRDWCEDARDAPRGLALLWCSFRWHLVVFSFSILIKTWGKTICDLPLFPVWAALRESSAFRTCRSLRCEGKNGLDVSVFMFSVWVAGTLTSLRMSGASMEVTGGTVCVFL